MSNLLYLASAIVLSTLGCLVLYLRNRKPKGMNAGIEEFRRELRALAPDRRPDLRDRSGGPTGPK